jgi:hypothetical protein
MTAVAGSDMACRALPLKQQSRMTMRRTARHWPTMSRTQPYGSAVYLAWAAFVVRVASSSSPSLASRPCPE